MTTLSAATASAATVDTSAWYTLVNRNSGKALDVYNLATSDGGRITQWTRNGGNQQFRLADSDNGNIVQYSDRGGTNQQWQLVRVGGADPTTTTPQQPGASLPSSLRWSSSAVLAGPKSDASHDIVSIKDYTVVRHNNQWQVYATNLWYLVHRTGLPPYSTSSDPSGTRSWSAPRDFRSAMPDIERGNIGNGNRLDFWGICDTANCPLFSSDDNGYVYRAQTSVANFPNGFDNTVIALQDSNRNALFEGTAVYKVGTGSQYLLLQEAIGANGRYYKSFTSNRIEGPWSPHLTGESTPFAGISNSTFPAGRWTRDISHGELVRSGNDQTLPINPCLLQFLYQGLDPDAGGDYSQLPYRMGLPTQTNSAC
ncbi:non-reducing end alpha-L-arabinofuranosidase family hydrolase [Saccharothrix coeruleofusca]|uniref:non-reducing end alpha-L-arabinofuranosidase family hydrolase n=1 Tax=Saccharothrix coeruleofusca TaxID=33919 RepID=UPI001E55B037|nr:non-reducing end alpha-L-arabinofuranosidase family hydrolase [Saccharothrix coeruleofusca]